MLSRLPDGSSSPVMICKVKGPHRDKQQGSAASTFQISKCGAAHLLPQLPSGLSLMWEGASELRLLLVWKVHTDDVR